MPGVGKPWYTRVSAMLRRKPSQNPVPSLPCNPRWVPVWLRSRIGGPHRHCRDRRHCGPF